MSHPPAILVAHGQPSDPAPQQAAAEDLAARVASASGGQVIGATLAAPGALDRAAAEATRDGEALVYPMFMAAGWFTGKELPRRLAQTGRTGTRVLPPFGLDPGMAALCRRHAGAAISARGWAEDEVTLLLIAHGSQRSRGSAEGAEAMAAALRPHYARVVTAYIEEPPHLVDAARGLGARSVALPFFATRAEHVTDDIPEGLAEAGFEGVLLDPVGMAEGVPEMIAAALARGD